MAVAAWAALIWACLNLLGFLVTWMDKAAARARRSRVPESTLLFLALVGAGPGALLAMRVHRHKTRKARFLVPFMLAAVTGTAAWAIAAWWMLTRAGSG